MRHKKLWLKISLVVGIFLFIQTAIVSHPEESPDYDISIKNGLVIDGGLGEPVQTNSEPYRASNSKFDDMTSSE